MARFRLLPVLFCSLPSGPSRADTQHNAGKIAVVLHVSKNKKSSFRRLCCRDKGVIQKHYGKKNIDIEIAFNGTGIGFVNKRNRCVSTNDNGWAKHHYQDIRL